MSNWSILTDSAQFPEVAVGLTQRGMDSTEVDQVLGGNFIELFERVVAP